MFGKIRYQNILRRLFNLGNIRASHIVLFFFILQVIKVLDDLEKQINDLN